MASNLIKLLLGGFCNDPALWADRYDRFPNVSSPKHEEYREELEHVEQLHIHQIYFQQ